MQPLPDDGMRQILLERLEQWWSYVVLPVSDDDCWLWLGFKDLDGQGRFSVPSFTSKHGCRRIRAYRYSYEIFVEPLPPRSRALVLCESEGCVNPTHVGLRLSGREYQRGILSPEGALLIVERRRCLAEGLKRCSHCKETQSRLEFPKNAHMRDGLDSWCRACRLDAAPAIRRRREILNESIDPYVDETPKTCSRCARSKHRREYSIARRARDGLNQYCRKCASDLHSIKKYGLSLEQRQRLLDMQEGCGICHTQDPHTRLGWSLDHDHMSGRIRGLLCGPCNLFLGHLEALPDFDIEEFSPAMSSYLLSPPAPRLLAKI